MNSRPKNYQERIAGLQADRDALFEYLKTEIPERLDNLTGGERNRVYRMLRLEVKPTPDGYEITGVFLQKGTDALEEIPGIGPATIEQIEPFATV